MTHLGMLVAFAVILWIGLNPYFDNFNGWLVRTFGKELLREKTLLLAREVVKRLYNRNTELFPTPDDDDLVLKEAAEMLSDYIWGLKSHG